MATWSTSTRSPWRMRHKVEPSDRADPSNCPAAQSSTFLTSLLEHLMRRTLMTLLILALALLIAAVALLAAGRLLEALGDVGAAQVVNICAVIVAVVFGVDLICLVLLQGFLLLSVWEEGLQEVQELREERIKPE
jgi:small neutral amino acid transporter SnatA (MarC family)